MAKKLDILNSTNTLKVLSFLVKNPGKEYLSSEIQKGTFVSRAGVHIALQELISQKLVSVNKKGRIFIYSALYDDPFIKQFKIMQNLQILRPLIDKLKENSRKIVLYGSMSRGEDDGESDVDLFILAKDMEKINREIAKLKMKRKLQAVIKSPSELAEIKDKEKLYYDEVSLGIIVWEEKG